MKPAMKATLRTVIPLIPSGGSLADAMAFFTDYLGFAVVWRSESMAGLRRDGIALNLVQNENRDWIENSSVRIGADAWAGGARPQTSDPELVHPKGLASGVPVRRR